MGAVRQRQIIVSVVSHGHGQLVPDLLQDIGCLCDHSRLGVVVTLNIPERLPIAPDRFPFPLAIVRNATPKGYGANHNMAFEVMQGDAFCVLNPDIRLTVDPFPVLLDHLKALKAGLVAPLIVNSKGRIADSSRRTITPFRIVNRVLRLDWCRAHRPRLGRGHVPDVFKPGICRDRRL